MRSLFFLLTLVLLVFMPGAFASAEQAVVEKVVDGDTLSVRYQGHEERIRLIGVDAPESSANRRARHVSENYHKDITVMVAQGKRATEFVEGLVRPGDAVRMEFDVERRDDYGRLLAYVYLKDGRMLNELLVAEGFAYPMTIPPNIRYQKRFLALFKNAREARRGLWADE
jgi:micrococcal nuclease